MKPFAEEVRELLNTLPAEFYNNQVGSRTNKEQDDEDRETINNTMLSICEAVRRRIPKHKTEKVFQAGKNIKPIEFLLEGRKEGYNQAIEDILKEMG